MALELRPYQEAAVSAVEEQWTAGVSRTLAVLPTGTGKTIIFANIIRRAVEQGKRCLVLAHRGELLQQAADKIRIATGLECSVEKAEQTCLGTWFFVTVGSVQTLMRDSRLSKFEDDRFDVIIVDEAHHCLSDSYQNVLAYFSKAKILGVTATPDRGDRRNLGRYFDTLAYEYTMPRAIKEGYLSPIKAQTIPLTLDLSGVGVQNGDYKLGDLGTALDPYLVQIADEMLAAGLMERKTVVFLPLIATSQRFCGILKDRGFKAAEVNGESYDRADVLSDFDGDKYNVLCNSMLLTEGWDCPSVDCIVVLRPTKTRSLYTQMVGRGTRIHPGKDHLLLLDFLWHTERHDLCHPAHLIAESDEVAKAMTSAIEEAGCPVDIEEVEEKAVVSVLHEREETLKKELEEQRKKKRKLVDPLQFEMSIAAEDLSSYVPSFSWELAPPSVKQKEMLEKAGVFPDEIACAGKASLIIDKLNKRRVEGLTTPKQIRLLENKGFKNVGTWEFQDASNMISRIAALGWKSTPKGIDPATYTPGGDAA